MELLDIYDENGNHIGTEDRSVVHRDALWHKTVHCWLYNKDGYVYFQRRREEGTLYTTASGHIQAGESVKEGFGREIEEELGYKINYENAEMVGVVNFVLDRENKDGSMFRDRVFSNVYVCEFDDDASKFKYDPNEVSALVLVRAKEALDLFAREEGKISGKIITCEDDGTKIEDIEVDFRDFLVNKGETAMGKYGDVLRKVIEILER
ncbi:MAG: NUDIX domain-containing protein [Bacilli bacterium]|nr:NUDIX domain-containing protein [Bacilli bacterium]